MTFPILPIDRQFTYVSGFADEPCASVCTALGLKNGGFRNGICIDSEGKEFRVTHAELPPEAKGFRGWLRSLRNPLIQAKLTFAETGRTVPFEELRQQVAAVVEADRDFYEETGDYSHRRGRVQRSKTYRDLISCFAGR